LLFQQFLIKKRGYTASFLALSGISTMVEIHGKNIKYMNRNKFICDKCKKKYDIAEKNAIRENEIWVYICFDCYNNIVKDRQNISETDKLLKSLISNHNWYAGTGIIPQNAYTIKKRFENGKLGEKAMTGILEKLGYEKRVEWVKKS